MGCGLSKKKKSVEVNIYEGFHISGHMPTPTNSCDEKYFDKIGENATFAVGSFWNAQGYLSRLHGIIRSRCGFSGGRKDIGEEPDKTEDHTQVIDLEYDPNIISYAKLLEVFWEIHDPSSKPDNIRYCSRIFYHTKDQKKLAKESLMEKDRELIKSGPAHMLKPRMHTDVRAVKHIFMAKKDEQQYFLQDDKYLTKLANCNTADEFAYSHLACKLNAYCSGYCTMEMFECDLKEDDLCLDEMAVAYIREKIKRYCKLES